jgi:D-aminoacyl-tRNA deacylase
VPRTRPQPLPMGGVKSYRFGGLSKVRLVIQRVKQAAVTVEGKVVGRIGHGLVVLVGVGNRDDATKAEALATKLVNLRIFADSAGKTNLSALDVGAEALIISQFTLYADTRKGRRPSFIDAAPPLVAAPLVEQFAETVRGFGLRVATGQFQAEMLVEIHNDGPFTIVISEE